MITSVKQDIGFSAVSGVPKKPMPETKPVHSKRKIRLLIIDEHAAVRHALSVRMRSFAHLEVLISAGDFAEGLHYAKEKHPDVIVFGTKSNRGEDARPIGELVNELNQHAEAVIVLTSYADESEREQALSAGARRYLLKDIGSERLLAEIEATHREVIDS